MNDGDEMKIVTWNSNGYFSERFPAIVEEDADIYVIQECENPLIIDSEEYNDFASNYYWVSENQRYGLGIFAKDNIKLELVELDDKGLRYFIPVRVNDDFNLLGVWTNPDMEGSKVIHYPKEITKYYEEHKDSGFFNEENVVITLVLNNGNTVKLDSNEKISEFDEEYLLVETDEDIFEYILISAISQIKCDKSPKMEVITGEDIMAF